MRALPSAPELRLPVDPFDRRDLHPKAREPDIFARRVGAQADRGDAEVAQDLRAEADFAPLHGARGVGVDGLGAAEVGGHACGAVAQVDQHAAAVLLEPFQRAVDDAAAENVADDVGAVQARGHRAAVADRAVDEREVQHGIERGAVGVAG